MTKFLVVGVNFLNRLHTRIFGADVIAFVRGFVPIVNPANKRRDQFDPPFGATHCLRQRKHEREIAVDPFLFQYLARLNALPCRCDLDENAFLRNLPFFVKFDQLARFVDRAFHVERQTRVGFGRNTTRHDFQNFGAELNEQVIDDVFDLRRSAQSGFFSIGQHFVEQVKIFFFLGGGIDQTRVCRRITRLKLLDRFEIARVGNDNGELLQLLKLAQLGFLFVGNSNAHGFPPP